jgi:hypothetical protein
MATNPRPTRFRIRIPVRCRIPAPFRIRPGPFRGCSKKSGRGCKAPANPASYDFGLVT